MFKNFKRILKFAFDDFSRNKGTSVAAIFMLTIIILFVTGLFFFQGLANYLTSQLKNTIDITAYFKAATSEEDILDVKDKILKISPNIKSIEYVSKEQALADFNEKHKDNPVLVKSLEEVGDNPFLPSLNIITNGDPQQYASVSNILQTSDFGKLIEKVDFSQKKSTIEKVYSVTTNISLYGIIIEIILVIIALLVIYNTIELTIESSKNEIATMKVVGASDWFIKGPFVMQGAFYGIISFIICFSILVLCSYFLSPQASAILPGFGIWNYFLTNWWIFVLIQLGFGVGLGAISALIVVKKHLEV